MDLEKTLKAEIARLKSVLPKGDELNNSVKPLWDQVDAGFSKRRELKARLGEIDELLREMRAGDLHGVRIQGRRPDTGAHSSWLCSILFFSF